MQDTFRLATRSSDGLQWRLRRNCSVTPRQLLALFLSLCGVSLGVAGFFWSQGATLVMPFAALELLAVGTAFVVYARHASDGERISLAHGRLVVEQEVAGRLVRSEFVPHGVQVQMPDANRPLVEIHGGGRVVSVGRYLRPECRPQLVREIRRALVW